MSVGGRPLERSFSVAPEVAWDALAAALPQVTDRASFYEERRRVEGGGPLGWGGRLGWGGPL
ncbi:MAG TPA: hypothetical protein VHT30_02350 [Acidimicrobiales bacterium]|nr:hypothetical protein [Acidimicrobiales bacterium]